MISECYTWEKKKAKTPVLSIATTKYEEPKSGIQEIQTGLLKALWPFDSCPSLESA